MVIISCMRPGQTTVEFEFSCWTHADSVVHCLFLTAITMLDNSNISNDFICDKNIADILCL